MAALRFAFQPSHSQQEIYSNLPMNLRDNPGPKLSIYIDITFAECPAKVRALAGVSAGSDVVLQFRAVRNGKVSRKLGSETLEDIESLDPYFSVVFVPPIRDIAAAGMQPFHLLLADAMNPRRGGKGLAKLMKLLRSQLRDGAEKILLPQRDFARNLLGARRLTATAEHLILDELHRIPRLEVDFGDAKAVPLDALGTGHQSAVVINLYRQLGEQLKGDTLFLFEEPDNHLHPTTVRMIGDELRRLSENAQVLASTHSPILINCLGFSSVRPLARGTDGGTRLRSSVLPADDDKELRALLTQFGIRASEPLLSRRVIVVEGPADATILGELCELHTGRTADQLDLLILPANGKPGVVKLCALFKQLDCDWRAVLDYDAAFRADARLMIEGLSQGTAVAAISAVQPMIDNTNRRGRGAIKLLSQMEAEVKNGYKEPPPLDASPLADLIAKVGPLSSVDRSALADSIRKRRDLKTRTILGPRGIVLWSGSIEDALLRRPGSIDAVESSLVRQGRISGPIGGSQQQREEEVRGILHGFGEDPAALRIVVRDLHAAGMFKRSEIAAACTMLFDGLD